MSNYNHKKGTIKANASAAIIRDPLFKQRIEKNVKGKGSFKRKAKHCKQDYQTTDKSGFLSLLLSVV